MGGIFISVLWQFAEEFSPQHRGMIAIGVKFLRCHRISLATANRPAVTATTANDYRLDIEYQDAKNWWFSALQPSSSISPSLYAVAPQKRKPNQSICSFATPAKDVKILRDRCPRMSPPRPRLGRRSKDRSLQRRGPSRAPLLSRRRRLDQSPNSFQNPEYQSQRKHLFKCPRLQPARAADTKYYAHLITVSSAEEDDGLTTDDEAKKHRNGGSERQQDLMTSSILPLIGCGQDGGCDHMTCTRSPCTSQGWFFYFFLYGRAAGCPCYQRGAQHHRHWKGLEGKDHQSYWTRWHWSYQQRASEKMWWTIDIPLSMMLQDMSSYSLLSSFPSVSRMSFLDITPRAKTGQILLWKFHPPPRAKCQETFSSGLEWSKHSRRYLKILRLYWQTESRQWQCLRILTLFIPVNRLQHVYAEDPQLTETYTRYMASCRSIISGNSQWKKKEKQVWTATLL